MEIIYDYSENIAYYKSKFRILSEQLEHVRGILNRMEKSACDGWSSSAGQALNEKLDEWQTELKGCMNDADHSLLMLEELELLMEEQRQFLQDSFNML